MRYDPVERTTERWHAKWLRALGMTQREIAEAMNKSPLYVGSLLSKHYSQANYKSRPGEPDTPSWFYWRERFKEVKP